MLWSHQFQQEMKWVIFTQDPLHVRVLVSSVFLTLDLLEIYAEKIYLIIGIESRQQTKPNKEQNMLIQGNCKHYA